MSGEGEFKKRIMHEVFSEFQKNNKDLEKYHATFRTIANLCQDKVLEIVEEAKKNLGELIKKPKINSYELTIPFQQELFEEDLERYKRFVKWFGVSSDRESADDK